MTLNTILILLLSLLGPTRGGQEINLLFAGDAMQHGPQIRAARQADGSFDYTECLKLLEDEISAADYAVVNLECPLGGEPYNGYPAFSAPDAFAAQLRQSGFDLLLTANNHCLDRRDAGLRRTITALDAMQITHTGTFVSKEARNELSPLIANVRGVKIAMLSYTYGTNGIPVQGSVVVNYIDRKVIGADIDRARLLGAGIICVNLHWGEEYRLLPVESQKSLAEWLIEEKGVDLIIGGHPHVIEPMQIRHSRRFDKDVLLVYSLGNFISNQNGDDSRGGAMVMVTLGVDNGKATAMKARYRLFFCQKPAGKADNYRLIPSHRHDCVRRDSRPAFDRFMRNARHIFSAHNINVDEAPDSIEAPLRPFIDCEIPAMLLR